MQMKKTLYLYCTGSGANAKEFVNSGLFTVLKGSKVSDHMVFSFELRGKSYFNLKKLVDGEIIVNDIFEKDYEFNAPIEMSVIILERTSNGNVDWKNSDRKTLRDIIF